MRQYDVKILPLTEQEIEKKVLWYNDPEIRKVSALYRFI